MSAWHRLEFGILLLLILICVGIAGYASIEGWSFVDSLYMTVITITTVGFQEVHPLSTGGRIFTMCLILLGVGTALYILVGVVTLIIEGELGEAWGVRRMKAKIDALSNHYILCGFGRVGEEIGREFKDRNIPFVVVESNPEAVRRARQRNYLLIEGDASIDQTLLDAGIERARGVAGGFGLGFGQHVHHAYGEGDEPEGYSWCHGPAIRRTWSGCDGQGQTASFRPTRSAAGGWRSRCFSRWCWISSIR